jgi:murein L,D-transpeptidase YcbB/YkuD
MVVDKNDSVLSPSSIDWSKLNRKYFPYLLKQRQGDDNSLGVIKFNFRNKYAVYLHDTNVRGLFAQPHRALSPGCIRVHKAVALARYLIKDDHVVSPEDLDQYLMLQHRMEIRLIRPMPLYLQYFTCDVKDGEVVFYDDVYGKDQALIDVLYRRPVLNALPVL